MIPFLEITGLLLIWHANTHVCLLISIMSSLSNILLGSSHQSCSSFVSKYFKQFCGKFCQNFEGGVSFWRVYCNTDKYPWGGGRIILPVQDFIWDQAEGSSLNGKKIALTSSDRSDKFFLYYYTTRIFLSSEQEAGRSRQQRSRQDLVV